MSKPPSPTNHGNVKLSDIARQTGYSLATVSKALNGKDDISRTARETIERALKASGYTRRIPAAKRQRTIEVVFRDFETIWALEVLRGILAEATRHDVNVMISANGDRQHPDPAWAEGIIQRQPIGAILVFSNLTDRERGAFQSHRIPFVVFDPSGNPALDDLSVQADNWMGGVIATRHLLGLGHRRIGIITGPDEMLCSRARLDGYSAALAERGLTTTPDLVVEGDFTTPGGYEGAMALLEDRACRPTAVFAGSDLQAMGVYEAARQLRLRIPEDLSVIGFDDIQTAAYMGPALTTVRQPLQDMAAMAARMVIDTAEGRSIQKRVILPTSLVVRDSTQRLATK